jgi:tetratricopeptide (TPR) repeat protein
MAGTDTPAGGTRPAALALELAGLQEALGQWGEALATLDHGQPGRETDTLVLRGRLKALLGDREGAQADLSIALERSEQEGDTPGQARALAELARLARIRGHLPQAIALYERSLSALPAGQAPELEADARMGLGSCRRAVGDSTGSRQALERARSLYTENRDLRGLSGCLQSLGDLARLAGDLPGARQAYRQSLAHSLSLGLREREAAVRRSLGDLLLLAGEAGEAATELAASLALFGELGDLHGRAVVLRSQGHLKRLGGDGAGARDCFTQSRTLRHLLGDARGEALALTDLAQLEADGGELPGAIGLMEEALELFTVQGQRTAVAQCLRALGDYRLRQGQPAEARVYYKRALELCETLQDPRGVAFCLLGLAESCPGPLPDELRGRLEAALSQFEHPTLENLRSRALHCLDRGNGFPD